MNPMDDTTLNMKQIGLYSIISRIQSIYGYAVQEDIAERSSDGRTAIYNGINSLISRGYVLRYNIIDTRGKIKKTVIAALPEEVTDTNWFQLIASHPSC